MTFWKTLPGMILLVVLLALVAACGVLVTLVWGATHPPRVSQSERSLGLDLSGVEEVVFDATDGLGLAGLLFEGRAGRPAVILAHDAGSSKAALVNLAIVLQKRGFTVLTFDFRGHGRSEAAPSTLGVVEKRDVIGAADYLAGLPRIDHGRVGVYGLGMGAHAAVLAAADRPVLQVLVLDALYPDASYPLIRRVYDRWSFGVRHLGFAPALALRALSRTATDEARAGDVLPDLRGRDLLLVAPEGNPTLSASLKTLFESLPQNREAESNLISVPAAERDTPGGEARSRYYDRVAEFLESRLVRD